MTVCASPWECLFGLVAATPAVRKRWAGQPIPWEAVLHLAEHNRLLPLLYDEAHRENIVVPTGVQQELREAFIQAAAEAAVRAKELRRVVSALDHAGIPVILLKGAALALSVYRNPALRLMGDVDMLLRRDHLPEALQVLETLGFQSARGLSGASLDFAVRWGGEMTFSKRTSRGRLSLDLHAHLLSGPWTRRASAVDLEALWERARALDLDGVQAFQLSLEDNVIQLCQHAGIHHTYAYVLSLIDIDRAVAAPGGMDWGLLVQRARRFELSTATYFGLRFTTEMLSTPVPERVLAALRPGHVRRWAVRRLLQPERTLLRGQSAFRRNLHYWMHILLVDVVGGLLRATCFMVWPGDPWLAGRYELNEQAAIRRARFLHPVWLARELLRRFPAQRDEG